MSCLIRKRELLLSSHNFLLLNSHNLRDFRFPLALVMVTNCDCRLHKTVPPPPLRRCPSKDRGGPASSSSTVKKEMKCSRDSEIIHEIVRDTTRKSEMHEVIHAVSRTISWSILESLLQFVSFLTVYSTYNLNNRKKTNTFTIWADTTQQFVRLFALTVCMWPKN